MLLLCLRGPDFPHLGKYCRANFTPNIGQTLISKWMEVKRVLRLAAVRLLTSLGFYCSAWSRLKLHTKIGLNHPPTHPPQTFRTVLDIVGG